MKLFKKFSLLFSMAVVALSLTACGTTANGGASDNNAEKEQAPAEEVQPEQEPESKTVTITHEIDETELEVNPQRIIVFDYGILDALDALGIDIAGLPKKTLPEYLSKYGDEKYVDVGTLQEPNFEVIYELKPELIFISARQRDLYEQFKEIAPTIYTPLVGEDYLNAFKSNMDILGQVFEKEDEVSQKVSEIEDEVKALNEEVVSQEKTALFVLANQGSLSVYGRGSRYGMIYDDFGFIPADENIEASTHGQKVSFEYLVEKNPDYLFVLDRGAVTGGDGEAASALMDNDLVKSTKAYKEGNIVYVNPHLWYVATGGINGTMAIIDEVAESLK